MGKVILPFKTPEGPNSSDGQDDNIYTYEGWRKFVNRPPTKSPARLTRAQHATLSANEQAVYDENRKMYLMRFGPLNTVMLDMAKQCIKEQAEVNLRLPRDDVKVGVVIDGHANLGKTTIAKAVARQFEVTIRRQASFPDEDARNLFIPVVHVTLLRDTTPKAMAEAICEYLHIPLRGRQTESQMVKAIYKAVERHTILLFVVDDIHFLRVHSKNGQETSNFLKSLMSLTGATFIYVGINVEEMGIFQEDGKATLEGSQTALRFIHLPIPPFEKGSGGWRKLLRSIDDHLILLDHEPGTLEKHATLLYNLTGGIVGPLMNLVRRTAFQAVGRHEKIDANHLRATRMDYKSTRDGNHDDGSEDVT